MTRLSSNLYTYYPVVILLFALVAMPVGIYTNMPNVTWYPILFIVPVFAYVGYYIYRSRRVYYSNGELYLCRLFSNERTVIRQDRLGSVDKLSWLERNSNGNYKITYYDDDNNVKYVSFTLNFLLSDGKEIIDKLNEIG